MVLEHAPMTDFCGIPLVSLRENSIMELNRQGKGIGVPGAMVLSKLLPSAAGLISLECAATPGSPRMSAPAEHFACRVRSVDGHPLPIDELKGTKPTDKIDLSHKRLGVASDIIIANCIKGNGSLKELMCAAFPPRFPANISGPHEHF